MLKSSLTKEYRSYVTHNNRKIQTSYGCLNVPYKRRLPMNKEPDFDLQDSNEDNNDYEMLTIYEYMHHLEMRLVNLSETNKILKERYRDLENKKDFIQYGLEKELEISLDSIPTSEIAQTVRSRMNYIYNNNLFSY